MLLADGSYKRIHVFTLYRKNCGKHKGIAAAAKEHIVKRGWSKRQALEFKEKQM